MTQPDHAPTAPDDAPSISEVERALFRLAFANLAVASGQLSDEGRAYAEGVVKRAEAVLESLGLPLAFISE